MWLLTGLALAGPPEGMDPDWIQVHPMESFPASALVDGRAWVRSTKGCLPGRFEDGLFGVPLCSATPDDVKVDCRWSIQAETTWWGGSTHCNWERDGAVGGGWGSASGGGNHGRPELVAADAGGLTWRAHFEVLAEPETVSRTLRPCTSESLDALRASAAACEDKSPSEWLRAEHDVVDGRKLCQVAEGLNLYIKPVGWGRGVGVGTGVYPDPVDCRLPCPENPDLAAVEAANTWLSGRRFADKNGQTVQIFRSEQACLEATGGALPTPLEADCEPEPRPWEE